MPESNITVGSLVTFGSYPQSGDELEPIEWRVLEVTDKHMLLISEHIIDCMPYNEEYESVTWESCTLRLWLNNKFYNLTFTRSEMSRILAVPIQNLDNLSYGTDGGNSTYDKVFCLSIEEAKRYFDDTTKEQNGYATYPDRIAKPTSYARENKRLAHLGLGTALWWLRSPGHISSNAAYVLADGCVGRYGRRVNEACSGVRPVICVLLEAKS